MRDNRLLAGTLSALAVAVARYCHPQRHANVVTPCFLAPSPKPPGKASHTKASRPDFRSRQFEPDTGKMRKMQKVPLALENKGLRRFHRVKARKMRTEKRRKCGRPASPRPAPGDPLGRPVHRKRSPIPPKFGGWRFHPPNFIGGCSKVL